MPWDFVGLKRAVACGIVLVSLRPLVPAQATASTPTFCKDVAPILYRHCTNCHRPGGKAPMPLLTYEQVRPLAKAVNKQVAKGTMPPQNSGTQRLTDAEKDLISRWVASGALQGDPKDIPPSPKETR
jgi:uncharacterized membrane protein